VVRPKLIHELLSDIIAAKTYTIEFELISDLGVIDGLQTWLLGNICNMHYIQPGYPITIDGNTYIVKDYSYENKTLTVTGDVFIQVTTFDLYAPTFTHGTIMAKELEVSQTPIKDHTPLILLPEPYPTKWDRDPSSPFSYRSKVKLFFLTEAKLTDSHTDDLYYNAVYPMKNLMEDVVELIEESNLFYTDELDVEPMFHTKFRCYVQESGTRKQFFSESYAGVSIDLELIVYDSSLCECDDEPVVEDHSCFGPDLAGYATNMVGNRVWSFQPFVPGDPEEPERYISDANDSDSLIFPCSGMVEGSFYLLEFTITTITEVQAEGLYVSIFGVDDYPGQAYYEMTDGYFLSAGKYKFLINYRSFYTSDNIVIYANGIECLIYKPTLRKLVEN
jgi:hypothetical protein